MGRVIQGDGAAIVGLPSVNFVTASIATRLQAYMPAALRLATRTVVDLPCLEAEVAECLVGFGHAVHFVTLLHGAATAFGGFQQLVGQTLGH